MNKRKQNSILTWFILAIIIFVFFILFLITYAYPAILDIEDDKKILNKKYVKYNELIKKWFDFNSFKALNKKYKSNSWDEELENLLQSSFYNKIYLNIDDVLYNKSIYVNKDEKWEDKVVDFKNFEGNRDFLRYLENRADLINDKRDWKNFSDKKNTIKKLLPIYSNIWNNKELTDLSFITYVEWILSKFNLNTSSTIWIKDIVEVKDEMLDKSTGIYYTLLPLELSGTKNDILNFLKFINDSWKIMFLNNEFVFSWKETSKYQLSEVESIILDEYIDSSYKQRKWYDKTLNDFLKRTNQWQDIIHIKANIKFFVSSINSNKINEKINNIIWNLNKVSYINNDNEKKYKLLHYNYNNLFKVVKMIRMNKVLNKNLYYKQKINNIFLYLNNKNLIKDISSMKKELGKTKELNKLYSKALKYKKLFLRLDLEVYNIVKKIKLESIYPKNYIFENK